MKTMLLLAAFFLASAHASAQSFKNGDLIGTINGLSSLPDHWQNVPHTDYICLATHPSSATPDLTSLTGPDVPGGIIGNPNSGNTFVSGVFMGPVTIGPVTDIFFHEGIMQTVTGLIPDSMYSISFYQAVVKQRNCIDPSGSWSVYIDFTRAGITAPTNSAAPFNSTSFAWEARTVKFKALAKTHTIRFLPQDDDHDWSEGKANGCLRMGIDRISLKPDFNCGFTVNLGRHRNLCEDETTTLNATTPGATYLWQDGSVNPTFTVTEAGLYWVQVTVNSCTVTDSVQITQNECDIDMALPNIFTPNHDGINDVLTPSNVKGIESMQTTIYNRWGQQVFATDNKLINWDGAAVPDGVYYYIILYKDRKGNNFVKKGWVEKVQ